MSPVTAAPGLLTFWQVSDQVSDWPGCPFSVFSAFFHPLSSLLHQDSHPFFFFFSFWGHTEAHGSSQARGQIRAAAASLHHSPSNMGSTLYL